MSDYNREAEERQLGERQLKAIDTISALWPPDSEYPDTRHNAKIDLIEALCAEWRSLPVPVLEHMARVQHRRDHSI